MARIQGDLPRRTFDFACRILAISDELPNNMKGWVVGKQLLRAGTSIGANVREADNALTDSDFAYKCSTARKEASETNYWLDLCIATSLLRGETSSVLRSEANELTRVLSTIVRKTQYFLEEKS